jgi:signal transduction histidine kinase
MTLNIQPRTRTIFIWVALIPVSLACLTYGTRIQFKQTADQVSHTEQILLAIDDIVKTTTDAETGQRGYLLTGQAEYIKPFKRAEQDAPNKIAVLRALLSDNPDQLPPMDRLQKLVEQKLDELKQTVELSDRGKTDEALAIVRSNRGLRAMEEIAQVSQDMTDAETKRLQERLAASVWSERAVDLSSVSFIAATLVLLFWAWRLIAENAKERDAAEQAVRELNRKLEMRVAQRTRELEETNLNLSRSNADLERFAYVASHDLQEPLRMVASYVGLIRRQYEGKLDASADEYIGFAVDGAKRMQLLIQDLLTYSRASTQALTLEPVKLNDVLQDALHNLKTSIEESRAAIEYDTLPSLPADSLKLAQVFQNLIGNAIKFHKPQEPPRIEIRARKLDHVWEISVRDNGIGFDPQFAGRIFILFQRLHSSRQYSGTGIGLAICKRIIEAHGGAITVESTLGQGSVFRFTLPPG